MIEVEEDEETASATEDSSQEEEDAGSQEDAGSHASKAELKAQAKKRRQENEHVLDCLHEAARRQKISLLPKGTLPAFRTAVHHALRPVRVAKGTKRAPRNKWRLLYLRYANLNSVFVSKFELCVCYQI